jgi:5-(carboxyamino)imidazole ribonucleotide synthase
MNKHIMNVGILGGGQLARMLALAGHPLGCSCTVLDPAPDAGAAVAAGHIIGAYDDTAKLEELAERADVVTYEFENVPAESLSFLEEKVPVFPPSSALAVSRDRLAEKTLFSELEIPTPQFSAVDSQADLLHAVREIGLPAVLKIRRLGYDGKGQMTLRSSADVDGAWSRLGEVPCILEAFVPFTREVSILAVRGRSGSTAFYPLSENTHRNGILHHSVCRPQDPLQETAQGSILRLLDRLQYTGVLALELFDDGGRLLANETASRVHNSGHWTIEGAQTSQFENHLRAVLGLPLGNTAARGFSAMVNLIGGMPDAESVLAIRNTHLHDYGKKPRPGRKLGHVTVCSESSSTVLETLERLYTLARSAEA